MLSNPKATITPKEWTELKAQSSWRMFKIMAEFVNGFETMDKIGPSVSIYGSARTNSSNPYYQLGEVIAKHLAHEGYGVITGGGHGVMEAANKGAQEAGGASIGLNIELPFEQSSNKYIDNDKLITHNYFFVRKVMFVKYAQAFIFLPGGFGTMDELFECLTLVQTKKIERVPIILAGKKYWEGLLDWVKNVMMEQEKNISAHDFNLIFVSDSPEEIVEHINDFYEIANLRPNFY